MRERAGGCVVQAWHSKQAKERDGRVLTQTCPSRPGSDIWEGRNGSGRFGRGLCGACARRRSGASGRSLLSSTLFDVLDVLAGTDSEKDTKLTDGVPDLMLAIATCLRPRAREQGSHLDKRRPYFLIILPRRNTTRHSIILVIIF